MMIPVVLSLLLGQAAPGPPRPFAAGLTLDVGNSEALRSDATVTVPLLLIGYVPNQFLSYEWVGGVKWDPSVLEPEALILPPEFMAIEEAAQYHFQPLVWGIPEVGEAGIDFRNMVPEFFPFRVRYQADASGTVLLCKIQFRVLAPETTAVAWMTNTPRQVEPWWWTTVMLREWSFFPPNQLQAGRITFNQAFRRGSVRGRDSVAVEDARQILQFLFLRGALDCPDAADTNDDGRVNITDAVYLLNFLFRGGPAPHPPFADRGGDPTPDGLACPPGSG